MSDPTPDPVLFGHRTVSADAVARFAELTGDYARIHVDQSLGEASPLGRGFAHGLLSGSWALGALGLERPDAVGFGDRRTKRAFLREQRRIRSDGNELSRVAVAVTRIRVGQVTD